MRSLLTALTFGISALSLATIGLQASPAMAETKIEQIGEPLNHPWGMDFLGDGAMLVTERRGKMFKIDLASGSQTEIGGLPEIANVGQGGLLDVLVSETNPEQIYYCYAKEGENGISTAIDMARLDGDTLTERKTIFLANNGSNGGRHFGCRLEVLGEHLYGTVGDRGARQFVQNPVSNAGSVVRFNLDGSVPTDNPDVEGWQNETYSKGHRNAQGMALNSATSEIWLHEHGPRGGDEINVVEAGENYGWPLVSHGEEYAGGKIGLGTSDPRFKDPAWTWVPSIAPSGMAFYQGDMFPDYKGHLLVGSLKFQSLYLVELENNRPTSERVILEKEVGRIRDVAVGKDGAIYLLSDERNGGLYRLAK